MDQDYRKQISQSFLNGMLKVIVLYQASVGPVYGGRLRNDLRAQGYEISPGSLYPLLHSLEQSDLLKSRLKVYKGRMRKYYEITVCGKTCLDEMRTQVGDIVREYSLKLRPRPKAPRQRITKSFKTL